VPTNTESSLIAANAKLSSMAVNRARLGCIAIGFSGEICRIDDSYVVKHPKYFPGHLSYNKQCRDLIILEKNIYERLGDYKGIITYLGIADVKTEAIRLAYAKQGDLLTYIQNHNILSQSFCDRWV
jgi:hypothetical protein